MSQEASAEAAARLRALGDFAGSERLQRAALATTPASPRLLTDLADTVSRLGREAEMEQRLRAALAADPGYLPAADPLSRYLLATGRAAEALAVTAPIAEGCEHPSLVINHIDALRALNWPEEALPFVEWLAATLPRDGLVHQQLASVLTEVGRFTDAEAVLDQLRAGGFDHPTAWLIRGYAMQGQDRLDEAESAYREAIRRAPGFPDPHRELAQLIWMRTGDLGAATQALDAAIRAQPAVVPLRQTRARLLQHAGDELGGYAALADLVGRRGSDPALEATASQMAITFDPALALSHARRALSGAPGDVTVVSICAEACLAAGRPDEALALAQRVRTLVPLNQHGVALMATAWRALGDDRYHALYDYERLVRPSRLDTPDGWDSLDAWLADLRSSLHGLHSLHTHPVGQSLRGGSQTNQRLDRSDDPAIRGFFQAIDGPIRRYIEALGEGDDPLRGRNTGDYGLAGVWSVKLKPGGRHISHLHPAGWLSSACYIELPEAVEAGGREGWIGFGEPGVPTVPPLPAEHWVKPEPGMVVLFPSYMWHGTAPFGGDQTRLTAAFDVVPT